MSLINDTKMYIVKPKIRIKDLKELQPPKGIELSKDKSTISNHVNNNVTNNDVCSSVEYFHSQINDQLVQSKKISSSHILKLELKKSLLKERLLNLEKSQALYKREKERPLFSSNQSCPPKDGQFSVLKKKQQSEIKNFKTGKGGNKSTPIFETQNISSLNYKRDNHFNNNMDNIMVPLLDPNKGTKNCFEFINVSEESYGVLEKEFERPESVYTSCPENIQRILVDKCYSDFHSEKLKDSKQTMIQPEIPNIEISEKVDSTSLRDGIIKASRTLINTQKALKLLLKITSRDKSLPTKQATSQVNKFHSILNLLDRGFDEIDKTIRNEYKHILSTSNNEQKREISKKEDENCVKDLIIEQSNSVICRSKLETEHIGGKGNAIRRKKRRRKAVKSDDETDETFIPVTKAHIFLSSPRRVGYERSCRKRKIYDDSELQEFENELTDYSQVH